MATLLLSQPKAKFVVVSYLAAPSDDPQQRDVRSR